MKIRNGFVSNSSSSSFIVYGFSTDDSCEVYDMLEKKFKEEDPDMSEGDVRWSMQEYLEKCGIDYCFYNEWDGTKEIGYILEEGSKETFNESLKKAEDTLKKFNEEHHTDFTEDHKIYSVLHIDF